jgi:hypothetical protein
MRLPAAIALSLLAVATPVFAKGPKVHTAGVGKAHVVTWARGGNPSVHLSLMVAPLIVDDRRKDWVTGEAHDVTDHSFVVLEAERVNDALPTDPAPHFIWQTGAWLLVDRATGRVTPLHLAGYNSALSGISWFRDYAAYCSLSANGNVLFAEVVQLGARKPIAHQKVADWPLPPAERPATPPEPIPPPPPHGPLGGRIGPEPRVPSIFERMNTGLPHPAVCSMIEWDRDPLRAVITARPDIPPAQLDLGLPAAAATESAPPNE